MRHSLLILILCWGTALQLAAQPNLPPAGHWVFFRDKGPEAAQWLRQPQGFLSAAALERYAHHGVALTEADVPVSATYLAALRAQGLQVRYASRWLNAAYVAAPTPPQLAAAQGLPCVRHTQPGRWLSGGTAHAAPPPPPHTVATQGTTSINYGIAAGQNNMLGLNCLHSAGYRGQGARVAFFDSGFPQMDQHTVFDSLFGDNRVLGTWDFYTHAPIDYTTGDAHGTWCSSIAIANLDGVLVGASPKASVYLLRTENVTYERNIEEYNWLAGAEWADSAGAQIISSSLSYNTFDTGETSYVFAQMDGQSTVCAQAAQFATARGILVVSSAGNEGGGPWGRIATPCDADSSLCVGAVNASGAYVNFSSRGPSADGRVKPDVTAQGFQTAYYNTSASIPATGNGTSFSCPLISGLAACLLSKHPTATAWQLRQAIVQSADRLANPDSLYGYGIPNACRADSLLALVTARPEGQPRECPELRATHRPLSGAWDLVLFSPQAHTYQLEVVDLTGRTVLREAGLHSNVRYPVSTDGLASGVYVLRATWPQAFCQVKLLLVR